MRTEIHVGTLDELRSAVVGRLEAESAAAIAVRGRFAIALPGGSAALQLFPRLALAGVDWSRCDFFWSDERAVSVTDPESNYGLAKQLWLDPAVIPRTNVHRLPGELADLDAAAIAAEREMVACLGDPPRLDWLWLGVGEDGHVASLFPGSPLLDERRRYVAAVLDSPKPPSGRLTLTLAAIAAARLVVVTALGEAKAGAVTAALGEPASRLPLTLALAAARRSWLLLDPGAARDLPAAPGGSSSQQPGESEARRS